MEILSTEKLGYVFGGLMASGTDGDTNPLDVLIEMVKKGCDVKVEIIGGKIIAYGGEGYKASGTCTSEVKARLEAAAMSRSQGGGDACVHVESTLPCGTLAKDVIVGSTMHLADAISLEAGKGTVSYSQRKKAPGLRIITESGVSLVCSETAPIPTPDGLVLAPNLLGKVVAVRKDDDSATHSIWERVTSVDVVGEIDIQHITVGDKCFWAGEHEGKFILHHNIKAGPSTVFYDGRVYYDGIDVTDCF